MTEQFVIHLGREAMLMMLLMSAPMLILGLLVGLLISILQAVTQIHEMTLTFIPKILAVSVAVAIFLPWMMRLIIDFTTSLLVNIPMYAK
ncbi:MAG: flagellar biosynthesis protein FliQ [Candidatus Latescibacteria bacterium]|nr:flagellar biosynthesis protein FliQ [Candidatus Latescibacterota bacterium]